MPLHALRPLVMAIALAGLAGSALAAQPAPSAAVTDTKTPAKELFGAKTEPSTGAPRSIGFYSRGCLAGAAELPVTGPHWQVMRLSRNRNWGHPNLVNTIERIATKLPKAGGWQGVLVGDMSQPRGGPMRFGHASHQVGLDVDIWLTPWPDHVLSREERETKVPVNVVRKDRLDIDPNTWTPQDLALIKTVAQDPAVERVFANPAIKKALCRDVRGDRSWLRKVRPYWGHDDHVHVRIGCPTGVGGCRSQAAPPPGDGCGGKALAWWFTEPVLHPPPPTKPAKPRKQVTLADLPDACRVVLNAPGRAAAASAAPIAPARLAPAGAAPSSVAPVAH